MDARSVYASYALAYCPEKTTVPVKALEATFAFIMQRALKAAKKEYQRD